MCTDLILFIDNMHVEFAMLLATDAHAGACMQSHCTYNTCNHALIITYML